MEFRLPLPPSNNNLVRPCLMRGREESGKPVIRLVSTREAEIYRKKAHRILPVAPVGGLLELFVTVYVPTLASDGLNRLKALEDACNERVWFDDRQIVEWHIVRVITGDENFVGIHLRVEQADPLQHPVAAARLAKSTIATKEKELNQSKLNLPEPVRPRNPVGESLAERFRRTAKPAEYRQPEPPEVA